MLKEAVEAYGPNYGDKYQIPQDERARSQDAFVAGYEACYFQNTQWVPNELEAYWTYEDSVEWPKGGVFESSWNPFGAIDKWRLAQHRVFRTKEEAEFAYANRRQCNQCSIFAPHTDTHGICHMHRTYVKIDWNCADFDKRN